MNIISKMMGAAVTVATVATLLAPSAFATTNINISGNGALSTNKVKLAADNSVTVGQSNDSTVVITVDSSANTGGNKANGNDGGDVTILTGAATSTVNTTVVGGGNDATLPLPCGCDPSATLNVNISGNGALSKNKVKTWTNNSVDATQIGSQLVVPSITSKAKTGWNKAKNNTGTGVTIITDPSTSTVNTTVVTPTNTLL